MSEPRPAFESTSPSAGPPTDATILTLLRAGSPEGLHLLVTTIYPRVKAALVKLFGTRHEQLVADAMSEAIYRLWSNVDHYDASKGSLGRYLLTIARNCAIGELRVRSARTRLVPPDELDNLPRDTHRESAPRGITEQQRPLLGDLMACVAQLPRMQQQIVLADLQADGAAETEHLVALLGTSRNAIWAARSKAHKRLQQLLRERGHSF